MTSIRQLLHQIPDPHLSISERVQLRCQVAKQFERIGNHEAARGVIDSLWPAFGKPPNLDGLDERASAEVLLRVGVLTGWIGSIKLIKDSQKVAKNLINKSIAIFESLHDVKKVAEAQIEIALCCVNEDALDAARVLYAEALAQLDDQDGDLKAVAVLRSASLELLANRLTDAFSILTPAVALFEASTNHVLKGCFHNEFARVLKNLGVAESRPDYIERALNEYAAASFHLEQAGHARYQGCVENNLAMLFLHVESFAEAHEHLDRAQALFTRLDDRFRLAELEETRARVLLAEGAVLKAEQIAHVAFRTLEKGDQSSSLAEALTTQGIALSRLQRSEQARVTFERAISIAEQAGDLERAGLAALTLVEQLADHLSDNELCSVLERARSFLKDTQNTGTLHRLTECAYRVLSLIHTARPDWTTFSLSETLRRHEGHFIQMALEDSGGSVTKAAGLLRLPGHQTLSFILNTRHQQLLKARTPIKPRRRRRFKVMSAL
jgi:tetratricopeptide (TPR) repeat protein